MADRGFDLGRLGVWCHLDALSIHAAREFARRVEALGYGTLWVPETVGREPFTLLGLLAGETNRLWLGTSIVSIWGHDAQTTRMAAMTLAEATGGQFVLGLGVSHPHLAQKLRGHVYDKPLAQMRDYLAAYRAARYLGPGRDGAVAEPPLLLAALREKMLTLAATEAEGAFPYLVTPDRLAWTRAVVDAAAAEGGRARPLLAAPLMAVLDPDPASGRATARAYLTPYLRTPNYQASWAAQGFEEADWALPGSDRLVDAMVAWGDAPSLRSRLAELHAAGADHVAIIPIGPASGSTPNTEALPVLEALAP